MHSTTATLFFSLLALTNALPTNTNTRPLTARQASVECPGQTYITPEFHCVSGFTGCVPHERANEVCGGVRRFYNDCWAAPALGYFNRCEKNGRVTFSGCSSEVRVCDRLAGLIGSGSAPSSSTPSTPPTNGGTGSGSGVGTETEHEWHDTPSTPSPMPPTRSLPVPAPNPPVDDDIETENESRKGWECPAGTWYAGVDGCKSGYVGCVTEHSICEGDKRYFGTCPAGTGNYYNCNGFVGCSTDKNICEPNRGSTPAAPSPSPSKSTTPSTPSKSATPSTPAQESPKPSASAPPATNPNPTNNKGWACPAGTWYAGVSGCSSGFVGCVTEHSICQGEKRYFGTCPANSGVFYNCNGFVGCTTDKNVCN